MLALPHKPCFTWYPGACTCLEYITLWNFNEPFNHCFQHFSNLGVQVYNFNLIQSQSGFHLHIFWRLLNKYFTQLNNLKPVLKTSKVAPNQFFKISKEPVRSDLRRLKNRACTNARAQRLNEKGVCEDGTKCKNVISRVATHKACPKGAGLRWGKTTFVSYWGLICLQARCKRSVGAVKSDASVPSSLQYSFHLRRQNFDQCHVSGPLIFYYLSVHC